MNTDRLAHLVTVLILVPCLAGCGTPATLTASAPVAQAPATLAPPSSVPTTLLPAPAALPKDAAITLTWFGQSTFVLKTSTGLNALLDPTGPGAGYTIPTQTDIDLVTTSHEHSDHNAVSLAAGSPLVW